MSLAIQCIIAKIRTGLLIRTQSGYAYVFPEVAGASVNAAPVASYHATTSLSAENVAAPTSGQNRKTCP